jgi:hypothetical protein
VATKKTARGAKVKGRRNCTRCGRWRHALDFRPNGRDEDGEAVALNYQCNWCRNEKQRIYYAQPRVKKRHRKTSRAWQRKNVTQLNGVGRHPQTAGLTGKFGSVSRIPIAQLLEGKLKVMTITELSRRLKVDEKRLYGVIYGYTRSRTTRGGKKVKGTKLAPVDFIDIGTVDRWLQLLDEPADTLDRLYPLDHEDVG